jgi:hypothetical protein
MSVAAREARDETLTSEPIAAGATTPAAREARDETLTSEPAAPG